MKKLDDLLKLGDPLLYEVSDPVLQSELGLISGWVQDLNNVMNEIRTKYNFGRAIAAPQLAIKKRLIYVNIEKPIIIINPQLSQLSKEMIEVWDDCMCFPNLLVKVSRHKSITIQYLDENWQQHEWNVNDGLSELLQHEYDHLDGVLCTMRAIDEKSFKWRPNGEIIRSAYESNSLMGKGGDEYYSSCFKNKVRAKRFYNRYELQKRPSRGGSTYVRGITWHYAGFNLK